MWVGAALGKNGLGRLCLVSFTVLFWTMLVQKKRSENSSFFRQYGLNLLLLLMTAFLLKGPGGNAYSATAVGLAVLCAGILSVLLLARASLRRSLANLLCAGTPVLAFALAFMALTGVIPSLGTDTLGRDATFTGRTEIWNEIRPVAWASPILGQGYDSFWCSKHPDSLVLSNINEGHNGYLDVFLGTGLIGLAIFFWLIVSFARKVRHEEYRDYSWSCLRLVFLLLIVIHNFTESSFYRSSTHLWALFIYLYIIVPTRSIVSEAIPDAADVRQDWESWAMEEPLEGYV